jgi:hypothetical protein
MPGIHWDGGCCYIGFLVKLLKRVFESFFYGRFNFIYLTLILTTSTLCVLGFVFVSPEVLFTSAVAGDPSRQCDTNHSRDKEGRNKNNYSSSVNSEAKRRRLIHLFVVSPIHHRGQNAAHPRGRRSASAPGSEQSLGMGSLASERRCDAAGRWGAGFGCL